MRSRFSRNGDHSPQSVTSTDQGDTSSSEVFEIVESVRRNRKPVVLLSFGSQPSISNTILCPMLGSDMKDYIPTVIPEIDSPEKVYEFFRCLGFAKFITP